MFTKFTWLGAYIAIAQLVYYDIESQNCHPASFWISHSTTFAFLFLLLPFKAHAMGIKYTGVMLLTNSVCITAIVCYYVVLSKSNLPLGFQLGGIKLIQTWHAAREDNSLTRGQ